MKTTYTKSSSRITALISGIFMIALLVVAGGILGIGADSFTPETSAQNTITQNESVEFTLNATSSNINTGTRSVSIWTITPNLEVVTNENFSLRYTYTGDVKHLFADDGEDTSDFWNGTDLDPDNNLNSGQVATISGSESDVGTYTYKIKGTGGVTQVNDEVTVKVSAPPRFNFDFEPITNVDIDGRPGATSSINLILESVNGYSGTIDVAITDVLDENDNSYGPNFEDENGDKLINIVLDESSVTLQGASNNQFAAVQASLSSGDTATIPISLQTMRPINEDAEFRVQIRMDDLSNTADDDPQFGEFTINADGFAPRTIEEF